MLSLSSTSLMRGNIRNLEGVLQPFCKFLGQPFPHRAYFKQLLLKRKYNFSFCFSLSLSPQILVGELAAFFFQPTRHKEKTIISGECCYFNPLLRRMIRFLGKRRMPFYLDPAESPGSAPPPHSCPFPFTGVYSFGLFTTTIFANAGQVVTGNQTPHFLSVCQPNYTVLGCQPPPGTIYVTDKAACTGNPLLVAAACKAFPSKDAALSAYAVAYTVV